MNQGYYNNGYNNNANNPYYNQGMYNNRNYPPNPNNPYYMNGRNGGRPPQQQPNNNMNNKPIKNNNGKKNSLFPLFVVVGVLGVLAIVLLVLLITRSGKTQEEPVNKDPVIDVNVKTEQIVGNDKNGYVSIPSDWVVFEDTVTKDDRMLQYSTPDAQYILTMDYYDKTIDSYSAANNMAIAMKKENATNLKAAKVDIAGYNSYMVSGMYPDGVTLVAYFLQTEDGVTKCVMVEGPDPTNSAFNIPKTFQTKKEY